MKLFSDIVLDLMGSRLSGKKLLVMQFLQGFLFLYHVVLRHESKGLLLQGAGMLWVLSCVFFSPFFFTLAQDCVCCPRFFQFLPDFFSACGWHSYGSLQKEETTSTKCLGHWAQSPGNNHWMYPSHGACWTIPLSNCPATPRISFSVRWSIFKAPELHDVGVSMAETFTFLHLTIWCSFDANLFPTNSGTIYLVCFYCIS